MYGFSALEILLPSFLPHRLNPFLLILSHKTHNLTLPITTNHNHSPQDNQRPAQFPIHHARVRPRPILSPPLTLQPARLDPQCSKHAGCRRLGA